jgi:organic radical activating enzyme
VRYPVAERFVAPQGEGLYTGVPMAFIRLVGCSVGQKVCTACDTDFDRILPALGGGVYTVEELRAWVRASGVRHVCLTGGEPLDRDLRPLLRALTDGPVVCHVETSGTKHPDWLDVITPPRHRQGQHAVAFPTEREGFVHWEWMPLWVAVSPKPGYLPEMVEVVADEVKVILGGLGDGPGWPTVEDAVRWAEGPATVYVQPRNERLDINGAAMREAVRVVTEHPTLRLSAQLHKYIRTR